ncbi:MAG: hypothetical protein OMM_13629 [Candidatus Magnetoglobus multicellularis str. Araruama]|uniref:Uncharacterized protein n=1 Tax=Candidatus Magnetoglobus multicellularis str. Araruama TaxID=890399 RepID=A0A1V1NTN3_9BACT|nr:MAG: hypothetical protein OMM_13629 [Candidatus Magnetoglobus multicellularis str. Araruama]
MATSPQSKYIYAFISSDINLDKDFTGINDQRIYTILHGKIAAVVSDYPNKKIRGQRKFIAAHHAVLTYLMTQTTPLPVVFGIISKTPSELKDFISKTKTPNFQLKTPSWKS